MPRSRSRKGRKPYRPMRDVSPALAAKAEQDRITEAGKAFWGGFNTANIVRTLNNRDGINQPRKRGRVAA